MISVPKVQFGMQQGFHSQGLRGSCNPSSTGGFVSLVLLLPQAEGILEDLIGYTRRCCWEEELRRIMNKSSLLGLSVELLGAGAEQNPLKKAQNLNVFSQVD